MNGGYGVKLARYWAVFRTVFASLKEVENVEIFSREWTTKEEEIFR